MAGQLSLLVTLVCCYHVLLCKTETLTFEVMDTEFNEVIFIGERDVVLKCTYSGLNSAVIQIVSPSGTILKENRELNSIQYVISEVVSQMDGGSYVCNLTQTCENDGGMVTEVASLHLYVQQTTSPRCVRNGTTGEAYQPGDWLLMSCYCKEGDMASGKCTWILTVEGSGEADSLSNMETRTTYKNKTVIRILVEYSDTTDSNNRYDCFRGSSVDDRCSIGPQVISSGDVIVNQTETVSLSMMCASRPTLSNGGIGSTMKSNGTGGTASINDVTVLIVIIVCVALIIIIIVVVVCSGVLIYRRRNKTTNHGNGNHDVSRPSSRLNEGTADDYYTCVNYNTATQSTVANFGSSDQRKTNSGKLDSNGMSKVLPTVVVAGSVSQNISTEDYAEIDESDDDITEIQTRPSEGTSGSAILTNQQQGLDDDDSYAVVDRDDSNRSLPNEVVVGSLALGIGQTNTQINRVTDSKSSLTLGDNFEEVNDNTISKHDEPKSITRTDDVTLQDQNTDGIGSQEDRMSNTGEEEDVTVLYAKVDKNRRRESHDMPTSYQEKEAEDYSDLYAKIDKSQKRRDL